MRFVGGATGAWRVRSVRGIIGASLPEVARLHVGDDAEPVPGDWTLRGVASNQRYTTRDEDSGLRAVQEGLGRPQARYAALVPITKNAGWWAMAQDERRAVFEAQSRHIAIGLGFLPSIARRLLHGRDLGEAFDFLTWFEYAPADEPAFDELLRQLRATPEWTFVAREVDIRLESNLPPH